MRNREGAEGTQQEEKAAYAISRKTQKNVKKRGESRPFSQECESYSRNASHIPGMQVIFPGTRGIFPGTQGIRRGE
jgi:uroporphyrinogen-III synthase